MQKIYALGIDNKMMVVQILKFDLSVISEFTAFTDVSEGSLSVSMSIDSGGNVYVYNTQTSLIKKFSSNGTYMYISEFIVYTSDTDPGKMTIDANDIIYVTARNYITMYNKKH